MAPRGRAGDPHVGGTGSHSPANVVHQLKGIGFPAKKEDLVKHARKNHAPRDVIDDLNHFEEREYHSMADVMKAYGKLH